MVRFLITLFVCCFVFGICAAEPEIVQFEKCPLPEGATVESCTIHEVRIDPCKEASENKPCKVKRGTFAEISFDFTPKFAATSLHSQAFWATGVANLPFMEMDTVGCNHIQAQSCPTVPDTKYTYSNKLKIPKAAPKNLYNVLWKTTDENSDENECCFLVKIKVTK